MVVEHHLSEETLLSQLYSMEIMQIQFYFSLTLVNDQDTVLMDNYGYYCGRPVSDILMMKRPPAKPWIQKSHVTDAIGNQITIILAGVMEMGRTRLYLRWLSKLLQKVIAPNSLDRVLSFIESICNDMSSEANATTLLRTMQHLICSLSDFPECYQTLQRVVRLLISYVNHLASLGCSSTSFCFGVSVLTTSLLKVPGEAFQNEWVQDIISLQALTTTPKEYAHILCLLQLSTEYCNEYVFT